MVNVKCTCCQIVIRRLYPRKYLTEYRHFYNQEKRAQWFNEPAVQQKTVLCELRTVAQTEIYNDKMYWVCNTHFQNAASCPTPPYHTPDIEQAFCRLYYKLKHYGGPIFSQMLSNLQKSATAGCSGARM